MRVQTTALGLCVSHHTRKFYFCNEVLGVASRGLHKQTELRSEEEGEEEIYCLITLIILLYCIIRDNKGIQYKFNLVQGLKNLEVFTFWLQSSLPLSSSHCIGDKTTNEHIRVFRGNTVNTLFTHHNQRELWQQHFTIDTLL